MLKEFKQFIAQGNMVDMAVGIVIGLAFGAIIASLVADIIMPPIGLALGGADFSNLYINLSGGEYATLAQAKEAGAATINYGVFIDTIIRFLIIAFAVFLVVKGINRARQREAATTKQCPYCKSDIAIEATRCPMCTSELAQQQA